MKTMFTALALAAGLFCAGTADAATLNKDGMTGPEVVSWLQAAGYKAELTKDKNGDPLVKSATGGVNFSVYFYDCKDQRCKAIQFSTAFDLTEPMTLEKVNEWNKGYRYLKIYLDDEGDPYAEYDLNVNAGRTLSGLDDDLEVWSDMIAEFGKYIGW